MTRRVSRSRTAAACGILAVCVAACTSSGSPPSQLSPPGSVPATAGLGHSVIVGVAGFSRELHPANRVVSVAHVGRGGSLPENCAFAPATPTHLVAAEVRYFGSTSSGSPDYILLCVVQLDSPGHAASAIAWAVRGRETSGAPTTFPFRTFPVPGIPGASGVGLSGNETAYFATGPYAVTVFASTPSSTSDSTAERLAATVARRQFDNLRA
jgi:hypothetical protein